MEQKYNFSHGHPCFSKKHVVRRKIKATDLVGPRIPDKSKRNEVRERNETLEQKELYAPHSLLVFKPFKCREALIEKYSCFHEAFVTLRNDPLFLNREGSKLFESMQEFDKSKSRSSILRADQLVEKNEQNNYKKDDKLKAKENGK